MPVKSVIISPTQALRQVPLQPSVLPLLPLQPPLTGLSAEESSGKLSRSQWGKVWLGWGYLLCYALLTEAEGPADAMPRRHWLVQTVINGNLQWTLIKLIAFPIGSGEKNKTSVFAPNIVGCKWIFAFFALALPESDTKQSQAVAKRFSQLQGISYGEVFAPDTHL